MPTRNWFKPAPKNTYTPYPSRRRRRNQIEKEGAAGFQRPRQSPDLLPDYRVTFGYGPGSSPLHQLADIPLGPDSPDVLVEIVNNARSMIVQQKIRKYRRVPYWEDGY